MMKRAITPAEHMVVSRMVEKVPDQQRSQLLADLKNATAEPVNPDGSIVRFEIAGYERAPSIGRHTSVDGVAKDGDGAHLNVILFTDLNDRLYELEIVRFEAGPIVGPDWTTLQLY